MCMLQHTKLRAVRAYLFCRLRKIIFTLESERRATRQVRGREGEPGGL